MRGVAVINTRLRARIFVVSNTQAKSFDTLPAQLSMAFVGFAGLFSAK